MSLSNAFRALFVASLCLVCTSLLLAQATPSRILDPVDDSDVVTLYGNTHPLALPEYDRGPIPLDSRLDRMVLVLAPDPAQQQALDQLSAAQQDPASPSYHQWLTPAQYGSRFGVSSADIARLTAWLHSYGFSVEPAPVSRRVLVFSGTAAQVADAFHVELHRYLVEGVEHIANSQDPQVPRALAPVISGVLSLHNFRSASQIAARHPLPHASITPLETQSSSVHYLFPGDFATIYDLNPL
jgi:subtilase family serine protease